MSCPIQHPEVASEAGITVVEVLVTCVVLLVGMLGVLTMLTGAVQATAASSARVGATNLARELVEQTRTLDYDDLIATLVQSRLQARGLGSGSPWTILRRGVTYTVTPIACTYDDPADKLAATPPVGICMPQPPGTTGDANGDDFRRTSFRIAWRENATARVLTQTALVINPSGGLGPRITSFTPVAQTITASDAVSASVVWTTTPAESLRWAVDDGASAASVTGSTSFATAWNIGVSGSGSEVLDGSYQVTAQPFDDLNIAGEAKRANVVLNRRHPYAPPSLAGGHDTRVNDWVELEWGLNSERDVLGYRVFWAGPDDVAGNPNDKQVCPAHRRHHDAVADDDKLHRRRPAERRGALLRRRDRPRARQRPARRGPPRADDRRRERAPAVADRAADGDDRRRSAEDHVERAAVRRRELLSRLPRRHAL